jgi:hypothetical protein
LASLDNDCEYLDEISDTIDWCPVFRPSEQEFKDFSGYIKKCCSKIGTIGIFKVIPPSTWSARKQGYDKIKFQVVKPIEQNVYATSSKGVYELTLIEKVSRSV